MRIGTRGGHAPAGGALHEPNLDKVGLVVILKCFR